MAGMTANWNWFDEFLPMLDRATTSLYVAEKTVVIGAGQSIQRLISRGTWELSTYGTTDGATPDLGMAPLIRTWAVDLIDGTYINHLTRKTRTFFPYYSIGQINTTLEDKQLSYIWQPPVGWLDLDMQVRHKFITDTGGIRFHVNAQIPGQNVYGTVPLTYFGHVPWVKYLVSND